MSSTTPGAVPGEAERDRSLGQRRLLPHAGREVRVRAAEPLGDRARDRLDLPLELLVQHERATGDARDELDRPVVVRRAEPARDEAEVGVEALSERALEILRSIADDRDPRRIEAEANRFGGEERPVAVLSLAANELASP